MADTRHESVASCTVGSEKVHIMSECITMVAPGLEAAPQAGHGIDQSECSDCSHTDPLPLGSGHLVPTGPGGDEYMEHSG